VKIRRAKYASSKSSYSKCHEMVANFKAATPDITENSYYILETVELQRLAAIK